jgi:hypothetical protein
MNDLEMTKNGITVEITVNTTSGKFIAVVGDDHLAADTWAGMEKAVDTATKKISKSVNVPFTSVTFNTYSETVKVEVKHGTATGLHSGTGNVLAKWDDTGEKFQLVRWNDAGDRFRPLSQDEATEYTRLFLESREASQILSDWKKIHTIDLKQSVIDALNEGAAPAN